MMNVNANIMRSPISPYEPTPQAKQQQQQQQQQQQPYAQQRQYQPVSPQNAAPTRGLGLYPCSMPPTTQSTLSEISHSPQSDNWSSSSMMESEYAPPSSQPPDIFSAAFDPFSGFPSAATANMVGNHSPEAPGLEYCQTPPGSAINSHRSSVSSYAASDSSEYAYTPRGKPEEQGEWYPSASNPHVLQRSISTNGPLAYTPGSTALSSQPEDMYRSQPAEWSKNDTTGYITELHGSSDGRLPRFDVQPILPSVTRIKKKRQRTTPEEATHECRVCGKLFKRSYNWKSHMETHNPERKYPHPCTAMVGNTPCSKKFQRKTDLDRHYDSVHLKARNHKCTLCGNRFARRDTLRRHTEDGCPKRFELGIRDSAYPSATSTSYAPPPLTTSFPPSSNNATPSSAHPASASANPNRWAFPTQSPASFSSNNNNAAAAAAGRSRSYSVALPLSSPMAPPSSAATANFPLFSRPEYAPQAANVFSS